MGAAVSIKGGRLALRHQQRRPEAAVLPAGSDPVACRSRRVVSGADSCPVSDPGSGPPPERTPFWASGVRLGAYVDAWAGRRSPRVPARAA